MCVCLLLLKTVARSICPLLTWVKLCRGKKKKCEWRLLRAHCGRLSFSLHFTQSCRRLKGHLYVFIEMKNATPVVLVSSISLHLSSCNPTPFIVILRTRCAIPFTLQRPLIKHPRVPTFDGVHFRRGWAIESPPPPSPVRALFVARNPRRDGPAMVTGLRCA